MHCRMFLLLALASCSETPASRDRGTGSDGGLPADGRVAVDRSPSDGVPAVDGPRGDGPGPGPLQQLQKLTHQGVTWEFDKTVSVGQFITGDYYVVGPVTVVAITPKPENGRNGSVLNLPLVQDKTGFDNRTEANRYDAKLAAALPIALKPGDRLLSSISVTTPGLVDNWLREGNNEKSSSPVKSVSVLTCLAAAVPSDAFRPSYGDPTVTIHLARQINRALLPRLAPPSAVADSFIKPFADRLGRPWIDTLFYAFDAQVDYMPMYGRETGRVASIVSLLLMLDLPAAQKPLQDKLLLGFVQWGIDLWGLVKSGYPGWYAHGGHGSGRKTPIVISGMLLGDTKMQAPTKSHPNVQFGEDMHTALAADLPYGNAWNGATVVYTGHMGVWQGKTVSTTPGWGPYEHLSPDKWIYDGGEGYRRCCTSIAWIGQALALRLLKAQAHWNHDAFFAYADRWMTATGDAEYVQKIKTLRGWDYTAAWQAQGQTWDSLVNAMWAKYRSGS